MSFRKKILACVFILMTFCLFAKQGTDSVPVQPKGKVLILVVDVSKSITNQIDEITNVLDKAIVQNRLVPTDYFVLIPFGDKPEVKYSGQLLRIEDKEPISNALKGLVADNRKTDIGAAMHKVLEEIVSLKEQNYDLYEPLVLFITDGEIYVQGTDSPYVSVDAIFEDELIKNKSLYDGWWFVGIENENRSLVDLPEIAKRAGRENNLFLLRDINRLEELLNDWISKIPPSRSIEKGEIKFSNVKLNGKKIKSEKSTAVPNDNGNLSWAMTSSFTRTPVNFEIQSASIIFQSEDKTRVVPKNLNAEAGVISFSPLATKNTESTFAADSDRLVGKGTLKLSVKALVNGEEKEYNEEFGVNFMTSKELLIRTWLKPIIIVLAIVLVIVLFCILKGFLPVKVTMEIVGKTEKFKTVSAGVGKKIDFGSKAGCFFKLNNFAPVVGTLERTGKKSWKISAKDSSAFQDTKALNPYKMGTQVKLNARDGSILTIKFKLKK